MYPLVDETRDVQSWYGPMTAADVRFDFYRPCTGEFVCFRVATEFRHDHFNYDEPKHQFLGNLRSYTPDPHHSSFDDRDFVAYSASLFHLDIGTFSTLEDLGDELHKWIFVERDFDMLQLRLLSMKTIAYHLYDKTDEQSFSFSRKWMLLTNAGDAPWRGGRHTAADWLMLIDDLLDRLRTETPSATRMKCSSTR